MEAEVGVREGVLVLEMGCNVMKEARVLVTSGTGVLCDENVGVSKTTGGTVPCDWTVAVTTTDGSRVTVVIPGSVPMKAY